MSKPVVDIVMLSKSFTPEKIRMTQRAIDSAIESTQLSVRVIVLEQSDQVYENAETIKMTREFNYNGYANYGASLGNAGWIMVANNDLIFRWMWLEELLKLNYPVVSPREPSDTRQADMNTNESGYDGMRTFSGWCFMLRRDIWCQMGGFDETFAFWHSDSIVIHQLRQMGIPPMIAKDAIVQHLGSQTLESESQDKQNDYTWGDNDKYIEKFGVDPFDGIREL